MKKKTNLVNVFIPKTKFYLWIVFILITIIALLDIKIGMIGYILSIGLLYYYFKSNYARNKEIERYIESLTFNINTATKDTLLNFPLPLVVMELDGTIMWYNTSFRIIFEQENLLDNSAAELINGFNPKKFLEEMDNNPINYTINGRTYGIIGNLVEISENNQLNGNNFLLLLYLIDNTSLLDLEQKYEDEKLVVGIIVIDNYDDLMQDTQEYNRPQMLAEIDKRVVQYVSFTNGILKNYERDRYLLIFQYKYLPILEEKKFDLLDHIKEINLGNKIPVTLSIGLGVNGSNLAEKFQFATASLDIALGRGGDQVVLKDGEAINFFGGKTRELEKRTRVKARVISFALRELIDQASAVMIMGHSNCDIDCIGSALGLYRIAADRGKPVHIVLNSVPSTVTILMNKIEEYKEYDNLFIENREALDRINEKTLLIVVDTYVPKFTECPELLTCTEQIVVIDHHRRGASSIQNVVLAYQETYASSACELVTELLQYVEERVKLSKMEAEALYAGIIIDTKNFMFKTGVRTFEAAAFLRRQGVDPVSVKQVLQNDLKSYIEILNVVQNAEVLYDSIAISEYIKETKDSMLIAAKSADHLIGLAGISAAFVLSYVDQEINISGRSLGEINVQVILEKLGGGGHLTMAGTRLKDITMQEAKDRLKSVIAEYMDENQS